MKPGTKYIVLICLAAFAVVSGAVAWRHFGDSGRTGISAAADNGSRIEIRAKVISFGTNPEGNIDQMMLSGGGDITTVHFPPHAAGSVLRCVHGDSVVTLTLTKRKAPGRGPAAGYELVTISHGEDMVRVNELRPPPPAQGTEAEVSAARISFIRTDGGDTTAFMAGATLVVLPPHARRSLLPLLSSFRSITVKGFSRNSNSGFVNKYARVVVQPTIIIIDSVSYLIR